MKKLLCSMLVIALLASCKKDDPTPSPTPSAPAIPTDGWTWDGTKHKQVYSVRQDNQRLINAMDATSKPIYTFGASFKELPTANGTYHIVAYVPDSTISYPAQKIGANGVVIMCSVPNPAGGSNITYWSKGLEGKDATVTITGGKFKIEVPEIAVTSTANDNIKLTGTIVEN